jgi:hypothetical protein
LGEVTVIHRVVAFKLLELVAETGKDGQTSAKEIKITKRKRTTLRDISPPPFTIPARDVVKLTVQIVDFIIRIFFSICVLLSRIVFQDLDSFCGMITSWLKS